MQPKNYEEQNVELAKVSEKDLRKRLDDLHQESFELLLGGMGNRFKDCFGESRHDVRIKKTHIVMELFKRTKKTSDNGLS